jgi:hypothetical protein
MKLTDLADIFEFLNFLKGERISFDIRHTFHNGLTVLLYLPGLRLEVDFFDDRVEYNVFEGDESIQEDFEKLFKLLTED